ncbi:hypothetical protein GGI07_001016 [Coemansia sp. Benny D115]|nr:hypothetical protein GGI07_001016 [Coemansia sp. Benny D115]
MSTNEAEIEAKHKKGLEHKEKGNDAFKKQDFKTALWEYYQGILYLKGLNANVASVAGVKDKSEIKEEDVSELDKDISAIHANMAACHMRLNKIDRVISCANQAINANPFNQKAKFRLAQGYVREGSLEKAGKLLDELEKLSPNDPAFAAERRNIEIKDKEADKKQRKMLAGMFDRANK